MKEVNKIGEDTLNVVFASMTKGINRYTLNAGKIFGNSNGSKRFKILKLTGDTVYYKDLNNQKVLSKDVDLLLPEWYEQGVQEIAFIDEIMDQVKKYLGPLLGPFIMGGLIAWLSNKLK